MRLSDLRNAPADGTERSNVLELDTVVDTIVAVGGARDPIKSRAPASLTWVLGALGAIAATGGSTYPVTFKIAVLALLLGAYAWAIRWIVKDLDR